MNKHSDGARKVEGIRNDIYRSFKSELEIQLERLTDKSITKIIKSLNVDEDKEHIFIIMEGVIEKVG